VTPSERRIEVDQASLVAAQEQVAVMRVAVPDYRAAPVPGIEQPDRALDEFIESIFVLLSVDRPGETPQISHAEVAARQVEYRFSCVGIAHQSPGETVVEKLVDRRLRGGSG
jgi:hypothetical protein